MKSITITILTLPSGIVSVRTEGTKPEVGRALTQAEALHVEIMHSCSRAADEVRYGADTVPLIACVRELISAEGYGHGLPPEARQYASRILAGSPV